MIEAGEDLESGSCCRRDIMEAVHPTATTFCGKQTRKYVVISCGKGNMYGHPHEEALSQFSETWERKFFSTDRAGDDHRCG